MGGRGYGVVVTEPTPEPTNAELLAALNEQSAALAALTEMFQAGFGHLATEVASVKTEVQQSEDRLRGEIRATEVSLAARIEAVQQVVRSVKADLAAHVNDPDAHRPHAA